MKQWHWYVYILECSDGLYHAGMTYNIDRCLEKHSLGFGSKFTTKHGFKETKYVEEFSDIDSARNREVRLKDFSRKKKQALWAEFTK